jgi:hypothetical protein
MKIKRFEEHSLRDMFDKYEDSETPSEVIDVKEDESEKEEREDEEWEDELEEEENEEELDDKVWGDEDNYVVESFKDFLNRK